MVSRGDFPKSKRVRLPIFAPKMSFETAFIPSELLWNQQPDVANTYLLEATITPPVLSRQLVIRRSVLVPRSYSLLQLHVVLVEVFGWQLIAHQLKKHQSQNRHRHEFVPAAPEPTKPAGLFGLGPDNGRQLTNRPFSFLESLKPRGGDSEDQPSYQRRAVLHSRRSLHSEVGQDAIPLRLRVRPGGDCNFGTNGHRADQRFRQAADIPRG
ncbi:hypothetical protein BC937DRAFT_93954 [Endogone sp. FLAS-F59071]|nr:hypothetical protein BC937DRAFT_93954 [Endogone sp. FLAS-F59071]|eukprot:RUS20964.1 hypothetical protein BC937DRAFT_93954 [Endogone sp. FLAS-F59071]